MRRDLLRRIGVVCLLASCAAGAAPARDGADFRIDTDSLRAGRFRRSRLSEAQLRAERALKSRVPGTALSFDPVHGTPRRVSNASRGLTAPSRETPERIFRGFMRDRAALYGLSEEGIEEMRLDHEYAAARSGVRHLFFSQLINGIPVSGGIQAHVAGDGRLASVSGRIVPEPGRRVDASAPAISAARAVRTAAARIGRPLEADLRTLSEAKAPARDTVLDRGPFSSAVKARLCYVPVGGGECRLAWTFRLAGRDRRPFLYEFSVDAVSGELLACDSLVDDAQPAKLLVFDDESPRPLRFSAESPHPTPLAAHPPEPDKDPAGNTRREILTANGASVTDAQGNLLVADEDGNPAASTWLADGTMTTEGNNVEAMSVDAAGVVHQPLAVFAAGGATRKFQFPLVLENPAQGPEQFRDASVTDLFFWCNYLHDRFRLLGFDEAAGNFQQDNLGAGGEGGDPVLAYAQYAGDTNNSYASVPPEGESPTIEICLYTTGTPSVDAVYDHSVAAHEYAHGVARRLVAGPYTVNVFPDGSQGDGLNEGWADWFATSICARPGDPADGAYPHATYAAQDFAWGNRRYPYSTRTDIDPLRFRHLRTDPAAEYPGVPSQTTGGGLAEAHSVGEIWCTMLWEVRARFVQRYGQGAGVRAAERLVVDGLAHTPSSPTFTEARDAILEADALGGGADRDIIWAAFAARGLGYFADDGGSAYQYDVSEDTCDPYACPGLVKLRRAGGEIEITLVKSSLAALAGVNVAVTSSAGDSETVSLARVGSEPVFAGVVPLAFGAAAAAGDGTVQAADYGTVTAAYGTVQGTATVAHLATVLSHEAYGAIDAFALEDIDRDGRVEVFTAEDWDMEMGSSLLSLSGGAVSDITESSGVDAEGGRDARWADCDNDGDLDLFVADGGGLFLNDGGGHFSAAGAPSGIPAAAAGACCSWSDYDGDGDLDLFVGGISPWACVNGGAGVFAQTTFPALGIPYDGHADPISWADFVGDGLPGILVGTDCWFGEWGSLHYNKGDGTFGSAFKVDGGADDPWSIFGSSWADYDNDGRLDLLLGTDSGNRLFWNDPWGPWGDCAESADLAGGGWQGSAAWIDFDNDGAVDLVTAGQGLRLHRNCGDGTFDDYTGVFGVQEKDADIVALGNADADPMPELFVSAEEELTVYKFPPSGNNYVCLKPMVAAGGSRRIAVGATVLVDPDNDGDFDSPPVLTRQIEGFGPGQMTAHVGVGDAEWVSVKIVYPDGTELEESDVPASAAGALVMLPNSAPVLGPVNNYVIDEGYRLLLPLAASDPDGDPLAFSAVNLPPGATLHPLGAGGPMYLEWTPTASQGGNPPVRYGGIQISATDGALSSSRTFFIDVRDVPQTDTIDNFEYGALDVYGVADLEAHKWSVGAAGIDKVRVVRPAGVRNHVLSLAGDSTEGITPMIAWPRVQGQYPIPRPKFSAEMRRGDAPSSSYHGLLIAKDTAGVTYYVYFYPWSGTNTKYVSGGSRYIVRYLNNGCADGNWDTVTLDLKSLMGSAFGGTFSSIQRIILYGRCYADNVRATM